MNKHYIYAFLAVLVLFLISFLGSAIGLNWLFGVVLPYAAVVIFMVGFIRRMLGWGKVPVPFSIATTGGQQKSFDWITPSSIDNPSSKWGVFVRMASEIVLFRSLFRNTRMRLEEGDRLTYKLEIWLWLGALAFHYAFFVVLFRHLRFFMEPVPLCVRLIEVVDSFFRVEILYDTIQTGLPGLFLSGLVLLVAVSYLLIRRIIIPQVRYISLLSDYFPLLLIFGIAFTGILMRYVTKVDIMAIKTFTMGLVTFHPSIPDGISPLFFTHLFFVCMLLVYFPFSKLMHLGGIFLSPTRNMRGDTRAVRYVNPWNYPVAVHTYDEYEEEFREKMHEAGLPLEKEFVPVVEEPEPAEDEAEPAKEQTE